MSKSGCGLALGILFLFGASVCVGQGASPPVLVYSWRGAVPPQEGGLPDVTGSVCFAASANPQAPALIYPFTLPTPCTVAQNFNQSTSVVVPNGPTPALSGLVSGTGSPAGLMASAAAGSGFGVVSATVTYYQDNIPASVGQGQTITLMFTTTTATPTNVGMIAGSDSGPGMTLSSVSAFGSGTVTLPPLTIGPSGTYSIQVTAVAEGCLGLSGCLTSADVTVTWPTYVAIGDSYAAGAGDPPYGPYPADGTGGCYRSAHNFPSLMNLPLTVAFPACSGATIPSLAQSVGGQPLQFSFLTGSTSLVTVMIGGNDTSIIGLTLRCLSAPFMSSDVACMNQQLVPQGPTFSQIIDSDLATLHTNLMKTYATIKDNAMQARVVAPTYPIPFPAPGSPFTCSVLGLQMTAQDVNFLYQITANLNTVVETAALDAGIEYVDLNGPGSGFPANNICSPTTWFLTPVASLINPMDLHASMHPNAPGETEMARLILAALGKGRPIASQFQLMPLQTATTSLTVPPGQGKAVFSSWWPGSDVVMSLTSPSGEVITRSTTDPLVNHSLGSTYEVYSISLPEAGSWTVSLYGADVAVEGEQVNLGFTTTLRVPGDVDLDGAATCADVAIVKASFGKKIGQTGFDVRADLNGDGVVNILDLAQVAKNLLPGVTCK